MNINQRQKLTIKNFFLFSLFFPSIVFCSSLENEKSLIEIKKNDETFSMRTSIYLQARAEYGDLIQGTSREIQSSDFDAYFRKASIGFYGNALLPNLKYGITLSGDETPQDKVYPSYSEKDGVALNGTYIGYSFSKNFRVRFGKEKLPYSRIYLVSSTRQAFSERPYYMFSWENILRTYAHTHISAQGKTGSLKYSFSIGKAWRSGDEIYENAKVTKSTPQFTSRVEWSPRDWEENKPSDSHLGEGRHFSLGAYLANQNSIDYIENNSSFTESRNLYGIDASFHIAGFNSQLEINGWNIDSSGSRNDKNAIGVLVQSSYYFKKIKSELAIRIERFDNDKNTNNSSINKYTLGHIKYIKDHNLKFVTNLEHTYFDENSTLLKPNNKNSSLALRFTLQFIL